LAASRFAVANKLSLFGLYSNSGMGVDDPEVAGVPSVGRRFDRMPVEVRLKPILTLDDFP